MTASGRPPPKKKPAGEIKTYGFGGGVPSLSEHLGPAHLERDRVLSVSNRWEDGAR